MEIHDLRVYDRSRVVTDWKCPRMRYLQYELGGKGVVKSVTSLELLMGQILHDGFAAIAAGVDIEGIATAAFTQLYESLHNQMDYDPEGDNYAKEQATLVEGILRGFYKYQWPKLISRFPKVVMIEEELGHAHDGLYFMAKPDLVLTNEAGEICYLEYKSTSTMTDEWVNSWDTAIQVHSTCKAIENKLGERVDMVIVQGLYKGFESYGKQSSPFCYGYFRKGSPPFSQDQWLYEYKAGFKRFPIWEREGGLKQWIDEMPDEVLGHQFPQTPPIFVNDDMIERFFYQRGMRENEIKLAMQMIEASEEIGDEVGKRNIIDVAFPQRFDQCKPAYGRQKPCPYRMICFGPKELNPLEHGFEWRTPHHQPELDAWNRKEAEDDSPEITTGPIESVD